MAVAGTHVDGIQDLHSGFASIPLVQHLVDFSVGPFPDGLDDLPGVSGVRKVVKDDGFPRLWKHLQERSPRRGEIKDSSRRIHQKRRIAMIRYSHRSKNKTRAMSGSVYHPFGS